MATWLCIGGTRLATPHGAVAVEDLVPGTKLAMRDGPPQPVGGIGRIRLSVIELLTRAELWPVRIAAGALADGIPAADAVVMAEQPLAAPGFAPVAAKWLVDGIGLRRPMPGAALDVYSLSLPGAPAGDACLGDGAAAARPADAVLHDVRRHLADRAGIAAGTLAGSVDTVTGRRIGGWAADASAHPVAVELEVDGGIAPPCVADLPRADLAAAGVGDGRRGFQLTFDPPPDPRRSHLLRLRRALDGADLPGSPVLLDSAAGIAALLAALAPGPELDESIAAACRAVAGRLAARQ
ncbi:MAG: Hint domain-containing protein [Acetobacteraceae bacterium]|nr:Hint domain-containing protein [Acetobacteraceae bacterium]